MCWVMKSSGRRKRSNRAPVRILSLAAPVPTMKSAEFSVDRLREYHGFLSDSGRW